MNKEQFYEYGQSLGISINDLQRLKMLAVSENKYTAKDMEDYAKFCINCHINKLPCIMADNWFEQIKNI